MSKITPGGIIPPPAAEAEMEGYHRYFAARHFHRQGRVILFALASELYENFSPEEAHGFFRQIGVRIAEHVRVPVVTTIDELETTFNGALSDLDWGYVLITLEDDAVALRQYAFPGHLMTEQGAAAWRKAFAAVLEGVYVTWLREQGGGSSLEVKVKNDASPDVLELAYGV
jgi:hypothetical protein